MGYYSVADAPPLVAVTTAILTIAIPTTTDAPIAVHHLPDKYQAARISDKIYIWGNMVYLMECAGNNYSDRTHTFSSKRKARRFNLSI